MSLAEIFITDDQGFRYLLFIRIPMVMLQDGCYVLNMAHVSSDLQVPIFLKTPSKRDLVANKIADIIQTWWPISSYRSFFGGTGLRSTGTGLLGSGCGWSRGLFLVEAGSKVRWWSINQQGFLISHPPTDRKLVSFATRLPNTNWWQFATTLSCRRVALGYTRPGKLLHNYRKSPCLMGKSTISTGPFSIAFCTVYQRVYPLTSLLFGSLNPYNHH